MTILSSTYSADSERLLKKDGVFEIGYGVGSMAIFFLEFLGLGSYRQGTRGLLLEVLVASFLTSFTILGLRNGVTFPRTGYVVMTRETVRRILGLDGAVCLFIVYQGIDLIWHLLIPASAGSSMESGGIVAIFALIYVGRFRRNGTLYMAILAVMWSVLAIYVGLRQAVPADSLLIGELAAGASVLAGGFGLWRFAQSQPLTSYS